MRRFRRIRLLHERNNQQGCEHAAHKTTEVSRVGNIRVEEAPHHTNADEQHKEACRVLLFPKKQKDEERTVESVHAA